MASSGVPSMEPSSTTMTSLTPGARRAKATTDATVGDSFNTGMMTEINDSSFSVPLLTVERGVMLRCRIIESNQGIDESYQQRFLRVSLRTRGASMVAVTTSAWDVMSEDYTCE